MIGHASKDEYGNYAGGAAGDSTQKEVCKRSWYNAGWTTVLRPKSRTLAEKSAQACEAACANNNIGYDQKQRNTLNAQAKAVGYDLAKITTPCECDCSSLMHVCAIAGGANLSYGSNGVATSTMVNAFLKSGDYEKLTDSKYLTSDKYLLLGDVLHKPGHTAMNLTDGKYAGSEKYTKSETTTTKAPEKTPATTPATSTGSTTSAPAKLAVDGKWGKNTTKRLQQIFGLSVDGIVSNQWKTYKDSNPGLKDGWDWNVKPNGKGSPLIKAMQKWAGMSAKDQDGEIGPKTIRAFQKKLGTHVDGRVSNTSQMVKALQKWANKQ